MATWFTITFEGEPTESDFERVSDLARQGYTSGQLINEPEDYYQDDTGWHRKHDTCGGPHDEPPQPEQER
jgi:hypothetical protein